VLCGGVGGGQGGKGGRVGWALTGGAGGRVSVECGGGCLPIGLVLQWHWGGVMTQRGPAGGVGRDLPGCSPDMGQAASLLTAVR